MFVILQKNSATSEVEFMYKWITVGSVGVVYLKKYQSLNLARIGAEYEAETNTDEFTFEIYEIVDGQPSSLKFVERVKKENKEKK